MTDRLPLSGIKVVAFEQAVAMPYCTFLLAELGAEVIKIERPGGEVVRGWDDAVHGLSAGYVSLNANKRNIVIDVRADGGAAVVKKLVERADVFVENFAPGVVERLRIGPNDLRAGRPDLIYCRLSGYGQEGPFRETKAYDLLIQGEAGILATTGYPGAPAKVGLPICDLAAGLTAAVAIMAALFERERGRPVANSVLDVSMFDVAVSWLTYYPHYVWHRSEEPPLTGMRHQYVTPYGPFEAEDGIFVNVVVASDRDWVRFAEKVLESPSLVADERFRTSAGRRAHRDTLEIIVEEAFASAPSSEWLQRLSASGLPFGLVRSVADVLAHPQLSARRMVVRASSPVGEIPLLRSPLGDPQMPRSLPSLGEHTTEVLKEAGVDAEELARLRRAGIVAG
jgi:crotonobetainyl-CoA:carnitine CoA-transferase CaiB-like acyl-CoA transferase